MMTRKGGTIAKTGFYWNLGRWALHTMPKEGGLLPGGADDRYLRVPVLALLGIAPLMGALYVVFLPLIGFAMVLGHLARKGVAAVKRGTSGVMETISPEWRPGEAYLAGKKEHDAAEKDRKADAASDELDRVKQEIDNKRAEKR